MGSLKSDSQIRHQLQRWREAAQKVGIYVVQMSREQKRRSSGFTRRWLDAESRTQERHAKTTTATQEVGTNAHGRARGGGCTHFRAWP